MAASFLRLSGSRLAPRRPLCTGRALTHAIEASATAVHPSFARYAQAVVVPSNAKLVFVSGQLGICPDGHIPATAEEQTHLALRNIAAILNCEGAGVKDIVRLNSYVTDREHLAGYMRARDAVFRELPPPASTLMVVSGFARPDFVVEVEAVAALPPDDPKRTMATKPTATASSVAAAAAGRRHVHTRHAPMVRSRRLHGDRVAPEAVDAFVAEMHAAKVRVLSSNGGDDNERREIARRSRDFFWYSPVLKPLLTGCVADALVMARSESDVIAALAAGVRHGVPITTRGAGTGNYGQAVPLRGGVVLDVSSLDAIESLDAERGIVRAGAGTKLGVLEEAAREHGWELRQHPSTRRTATVGGFVGGGSTGHGALLHGGLSEDGAVLGVRVVTAESPQPRVLELRGRDVFPVVHAYGTNGVITAVELPLARAQPWRDVTAVFPTLGAAAAFALEVANAPAVVCRAVSTWQAPLPDAFLDADTHMHSAGVEWRQALREGGARHVTMVQCAPPSVGPVERLAADHNGQISRVLDATSAQRPMYENGWNHTTLHALKKDKATTYLQAVLEPEKALSLVEAVRREFATSELQQHLEVTNFNGRYGFASLALLWPQGADLAARNGRLAEILAWHEANGMPVFDPHTHVLEDGGMKVTDWAQLGFKRRVDPSGVLNPGKMRAWEEQQASVEAADPRGAFAASYRLADTSAVGAATDVGATADDDAVTAHTHTPPPPPVERSERRSRWWAEWSTADFAAADLREAVAVLPLGTGL